MDAQEQGRKLIKSALNGDLEALRAALAAGVDANFQTEPGVTPTALYLAALKGHMQCAAALLAAGADVNRGPFTGFSPLHAAALAGHVDCLQLLVAAGASPTASALLTHTRLTPLHLAAQYNRTAAVSFLLQAAPVAALSKDAGGRTPLHLAVVCPPGYSIPFSSHTILTVRCLLEEGPLLPADEALEALAQEEAEGWVRPLYAILARRHLLTAEQWALVPRLCSGLGAALPAVLQRSACEAALLVHHLPLLDQWRLRMAAKCLARAQRLSGTSLPAPILWRVLAQSADA